MTTTKINSIKKIRLLIGGENNINKLINYYNIVEKLMYHYKRVLNKAKEMESIQLLLKIKIVMIEKITCSISLY
jgi:hypothetical protein